MSRISSSVTFLYKLVPTIFLGSLMVVVAGLLLAAIVSRAFPLEPMMIALFLAPAFLAYLIIRLRVRGVVDEVLDVGDALIIRDRDQEERVALSEVGDITYSPWPGLPLRATLCVRRPTIFGTQIPFCANSRIAPFYKLAKRIAAERRA
jgi:hypothetical protein